jgi:hypothetical protein
LQHTSAGVKIPSDAATLSEESQLSLAADSNPVYKSLFASFSLEKEDSTWGFSVSFVPAGSTPMAP